MKKKLLWVGDAVCASGFARATHYTLETLRQTFDVAVLGINHQGDPHDLPYKVYPALTYGGDFLGIKRCANIVDVEKPDVIVIQNDPWHFPAYRQVLPPAIPVVGAVAIDGKNARGQDLNGLAGAIFWTEFGRDEAVAGGYAGPTAVVPLGVDRRVYRQVDRLAARQELGLPPRLLDKFIVGNLNRNQPRKRLDLTIMYFAEWVKSCQVDDAFLYLHVSPTGEVGTDVKQLMKYYGLTGRDNGRLILAQPDIGYGSLESIVALTYNAFDVQMSTTQGEGFGLPTLEGMACGIPQIVPEWSALGEWARGAAHLVPCTSQACSYKINAIGGIADKEQFVRGLDMLYRHPEYRARRIEESLKKAAEPRYDWRNIGQQFGEAVSKFCADFRYVPPVEEAK